MSMELLGGLKNPHLLVFGYYHKQSWIDLQACTLSSIGNSLYLYSLGAKPEFWLGHRVFDRFLFCVVLHSISSKSWDSTLIRP